MALIGFEGGRFDEHDIGSSASDQKYRAIDELIPFGTWEAEVDGAATYLSPSFAEVTGIPQAELLGDGWLRALPSDEHRDEMRQAWFRATQSGSFWDHKFSIVARDGSLRTLIGRGIPLCDEYGRRSGWVGINLDVTEQERQATFRASLAAIVRSIAGDLDTERVLRSVSAAAVAATGADWGMICDRENDGWRVRMVEGDYENDIVGVYLTDAEAPVSVRAIRTGKAQFVQNASQDWDTVTDSDAKHAIKSLIAIPLMRPGMPGGVLALIYESEVALIDDSLMRFSEELGEAVGVALQAAALHEHQRRVAETLQESLLTVPDRVPGVRLDHLYRSAAEDERIGGDFYDAFRTEDRVCFAIGDVSGKGMDAATVTALAKNALRAYLVDRMSPAQAMTKLNELVLAFTEPSVFITVFAGVLDVKSGQLTYCSAGHPAPVALVGGRARLLTGNDTVAGALPDVMYVDRRFVLGPEESLLLYTDGIIEARSDHGLFGQKRLLELLNTLDHADGGRLLQEVFDAANNFSADQLRDDVALLSIQLADEEDAR